MAEMSSQAAPGERSVASADGATEAHAPVADAVTALSQAGQPGAAADPFPEPETDRPIGVSFRRSYARRVASGFMHRYFSGTAILDIGFRGGDPDAVPITADAIGIELDYPGYDGVHLPFPDDSQDTVLAGHVLEHVPLPRPVLQDWYRVLKVGGFMVIIVPHRDLFERVRDLPSRWNGDHKRFYTPASLLADIEDALPVNGHRIRHLADNDVDFEYDRPIDQPPAGCYEIELVIEKIRRPDWSDQLRYPPAEAQAVARLDDLIRHAVAENLRHPGAGTGVLSAMLPGLTYFPAWIKLRQHFVFTGAPELDRAPVTDVALADAVRPLLELVAVDDARYVGAYTDLQSAIEQGTLSDPRRHWLTTGYFEGRMASWPDPA